MPKEEQLSLIGPLEGRHQPSAELLNLADDCVVADVEIGTDPLVVWVGARVGHLLDQESKGFAAKFLKVSRVAGLAVTSITLRLPMFMSEARTDNRFGKQFAKEYPELVSEYYGEALNFFRFTDNLLAANTYVTQVLQTNPHEIHGTAAQ